LTNNLELQIWNKLAKISWMPFEEARDFIRSLKLKGNNDWRKYSKSRAKPGDLPTHPDRTYKNKGWFGWGDWLGTGTIATFNRKYRRFEEAREFVRSLKIKGDYEWREYCKSENLPADIPSNPNNTYSNKGWKGIGDWLGTGTIATKDREYKQFKAARDFVHELFLKNQNEWREYCKSGNKPDDIPFAPHHTYKNKGWKGFGDWLGTGNIATQDRQYKSFNEARDFVRKLGIKNNIEWLEYCKSGKKPYDIPFTPHYIYKNSEWNGVGDWLGTGIIASQNKKFRSFKEARKFVRELGLKSQKYWRQYCSSGNKPDDIPTAPERHYSNYGWKSYPDWLGSETSASQNKVYRPYDNAKEFANKLKLKNTIEWYEYCKSGKKPDDIPSNPQNTYKNKGWKGIGDWLGK